MKLTVSDDLIYFISDTHLGDGSGADRFRYPDQLMALLHKIQNEPNAHLVLLGDVMELWATSLEPVLITHAPVFYLLGQMAATHRITYVVGNHDCLPWYYYVGQGAGNIQVVETFVAAQGALVAVHGHQFDPYNKVKIEEGHVKAPWTRRLVQAVGLLGRVGGASTGDALADVGDVLEKVVAADGRLQPFLAEAQRVLQRQSPGERGYPAGESAYVGGAINFMRKGARFVVMGHTHHPLIRQYGARTYVNTGSWVWDKYPPTYGRFFRGTLDLFDADTHQPYRPAPAK